MEEIDFNNYNYIKIMKEIYYFYLMLLSINILLIFTCINVVISRMCVSLYFYKIKNNLIKEKLTIFKEKLFNLVKKYEIYHNNLKFEEKIYFKTLF